MKVNNKFRVKYVRPAQQARLDVSLDCIEHVITLCIKLQDGGTLRLHLGHQEAFTVGTELLSASSDAADRGYTPAR